MADIVPTLFGFSPEMYQQQQQDRVDAQALQFARLSPIQKASFGVQRGANMLAGAIGGALGAQDPELQRITARQQIASQIDLTDPASIQQGMAMLRDAGDTVGMQQLAQIFRQQQESGALIAQRNAAAQASLAASTRERAAPTTNELTNARAIAAAAGPEGSPEYNAAFNAEYQRLTTKEPKEPKGPSFGAEAERASKALYGKPFAELTPVEAAEVNRAVTESQKSVAAAGVPRSPGEPVKTKDWIDFSTKILSGDPTMVRTNTIISDAPSAIETIRTSTSNDISAASLPSALALLTGQGKNMSNQDVQRFARTGGLDDRLAQDAVKFFTGRTTKVKKDQAEKFATALYRGALIEQKARLQNQAEQFGYLDSPNYKTAVRQLDDRLAQFKLKTSGGTEKPAAASSTGLSAAEQAELDQLRSRFKRNPQ